ncbi:hypothetical protein BKK81_00635 [Cupriavidus sp. USMAHM13]|uniref:L,D-transpeptidase n=1 Tax=Cupriavidus sp. USMAHM13 TaxID=1389192 RepID=UPI0008A6AFF9|nr:hypothetical protein BKK81_00635 [Cupriavidus sp. USMAHM13]
MWHPFPPVSSGTGHWLATPARRSSTLASLILMLVARAVWPAPAPLPATDLERVHAALVAGIKRHRAVAPARADYYAGLLDAALARQGLEARAGGWVLVVDRNPRIQTVLVYTRAAPDGPWQWVGAAPISTGRPGRYDYFVTPTGVFEHSLDNMDFRAEGTLNENGIRGYGARGMRVYDFGWVEAERGWGKGGRSEIRLQMHATDPVYLEPRLGQAASKGCVRIPAALNRIVDAFGLLDADYLDAVARGDALWVLRRDRTPVSFPGRYLVIVDSARKVSGALAVRGETPRGVAGATANMQ